MKVLLSAWTLSVAMLLQSPAAPGERPLPDTDMFFEAVRGNVARAQRDQYRYAYKERRTDVHTNPFGRIGTGGTRVFDVVPAADGGTLTRRLIERDDKPVEDGTPERVNVPQRRNPNASRNVDDIVQTLTFKIARRELSNGTPMIVVDFEPRLTAKPTTRQGRMARAFKGSMWVNEAAQEVERVEATAVQDISYGLGLVAKVRKGATVTAERKPVEGGIWMPTSLRFNGEGRAMLFRKLDVEYAIDWFDYRLVRDTR
jgi:hypothetical protein